MNEQCIYMKHTFNLFNTTVHPKELFKLEILIFIGARMLGMNKWT